MPDGADEEEYEEEDEEEDKEKFKDQLTCVGVFGRHVPQHSIPLLTRSLHYTSLNIYIIKFNVNLLNHHSGAHCGLCMCQ